MMTHLISHKKLLITIASIIIGLVLLLQLIQLFYLKDLSSKEMIRDASIRSIIGLMLIFLLYQQGYNVFKKPIKGYIYTLLVIIPAIIISINNFPISAYFGGRFTNSSPKHIVYLFIVECLIVAFLEEVAFRGVIFIVLLQKFSKNKTGYFKAIIISNLIFGLTHLLNLLIGASFTSVLLQIGYSFLMGMLWAVIYLQTQNIVFPIILHAIYNFFGLILFKIGTVINRFDAITIIVTIIIAIFTTLFYVMLFYKLTDEEVERIYQYDVIK